MERILNNSKIIILKRVGGKYYITKADESNLDFNSYTNLNEENSVNSKNNQQSHCFNDHEITNKIREFLKVINLTVHLLYQRKSLLCSFKNIIKNKRCLYLLNLEFEQQLELNEYLINQDINIYHSPKKKQSLDRCNYKYNNNQISGFEKSKQVKSISKISQYKQNCIESNSLEKTKNDRSNSQKYSHRSSSKKNNKSSETLSEKSYDSRDNSKMKKCSRSVTSRSRSISSKNRSVSEISDDGNRRQSNSSYDIENSRSNSQQSYRRKYSRKHNKSSKSVSETSCDSRYNRKTNQHCMSEIYEDRCSRNNNSQEEIENFRTNSQKSYSRRFSGHISQRKRSVSVKSQNSYGRKSNSQEEIQCNRSNSSKSYGRKYSRRNSKSKRSVSVKSQDSYERKSNSEDEDEIENYRSSLQKSYGRKCSRSNSKSKRSVSVKSEDSYGRKSNSEDEMENYRSSLQKSYGRKCSRSNSKSKRSVSVKSQDSYGRKSNSQVEIQCKLSNSSKSCGRIQSRRNSKSKISESVKSQESYRRKSNSEDEIENYRSSSQKSYGSKCSRRNSKSKRSMSINSKDSKTEKNNSRREILSNTQKSMSICSFDLNSRYSSEEENNRLSKYQKDQQEYREFTENKKIIFFVDSTNFKNQIKNFAKVERNYSCIQKLLQTNKDQIENLEELQLQFAEIGDFIKPIFNPFFTDKEELRIIQDHLLYFDFNHDQGSIPVFICKKYQNLYNLLKDNDSKIKVEWTIFNIHNEYFEFDEQNEEVFFPYKHNNCGQKYTYMRIEQLNKISQTFSFSQIETENLHILFNPFRSLPDINININLHTNFRVVRVYKTYWCHTSIILRENRFNEFHYYDLHNGQISEGRFVYFTDVMKEKQKIMVQGLNKKEKIFKIVIPCISKRYSKLTLYSLLNLKQIQRQEHLLQDTMLLTVIVMYDFKILRLLKFNPHNLLIDLLID